jgi:NADH-quinone oxidoreductase subunit J
MADFILVALGLITVGAGVGVISSKETVNSALFLTLHLLGIGGLFLALHHQFLAVAQMLIYAGAVMVVFMFAVTTMPGHEEPLKFGPTNSTALLGVATGLLSFGGLFWGLSSFTFKAVESAEPVKLELAESFANDLFGPFLLPFEGTAFLLLTALIGAVILGGRRQVGDG